MGSVELWPVVELDPSLFELTAREAPGLAPGGAPLERRSEWPAALAERGLEPLEGTWLVRVEQLRDAELLGALVAGRFDLEERELETGEVGPPLVGGFVLAVAGEPRVLPGCCADLGNLASWEALARGAGEDWAMVWIGHPWVSARSSADGLLEISEPHERSQPRRVHLAVAPHELRAAAERARQALYSLKARLRPLVERSVAPERVEALLAGLVGEEEWGASGEPGS